VGLVEGDRVGQDKTVFGHTSRAGAVACGAVVCGAVTWARVVSVSFAQISSFQCTFFLSLAQSHLFLISQIGSKSREAYPSIF
jgi:hypothetical protein